MGKVEDLRAIKDARFAAAQKPVITKPVVEKAVAAKVPADKSAVQKPEAAARQPTAAVGTASPAANAESLCGHRAIGGKTCIRAKGHDEASHKYAKS